MDLKNKTMWITGASSGIGEAVARVCAAKGAFLILSARNEEKLAALKAELPNSEKHLVAPLDLSRAEDIPSRVAAVLKKIEKVDVLLNNGGIGQRGPARETILDVQRKVMEVNYFGTIALTQAILPSMIKAKSGMIATVASVAGLVGGKSMAGYSASKHAIVGYMDCLRAEEAEHGIKVLNICPGFVQTQISVNAMKGNGEQFAAMASSIKNGIPVTECADKIVAAIEKEKAQVIIGKGISYWAPTIYKLFPHLFRKMAAAKNYRE
ncbi:SDR family NAD(P)-dependent oxidoreductase [Thalassotalea fusca]